jgi:hypothetical protein
MTIDIYDGKHKIVMPSRKVHVKVSDDFISHLEEICQPGIAKYRFITK